MTVYNRTQALTDLDTRISGLRFHESRTKAVKDEIWKMVEPVLRDIVADVSHPNDVAGVLPKAQFAVTPQGGVLLRSVIPDEELFCELLMRNSPVLSQRVEILDPSTRMTFGESSQQLRRAGFDSLYDALILSVIGAKHRGIYLAPAFAPFNTIQPSFAKGAAWDLIDKMDLNDSKSRHPNAFNVFGIWNYVNFDISASPNYPKGITQGKYDIVAAYADWGENATTWLMASDMVKSGKLMITYRNNTDELKKFGFNVFYDTGLGCFHHVLLEKQ